MKKVLQAGLFVLALLALTATTVSAQKFGYLNSDKLLSELPAIKAADSKLEAFSKQKQSALEAEIKTFQTKYSLLAQEVQQGKLSPQQQKLREGELVKEQEAIQKKEQEAQLALLEKRKEVYQPIIDQVEAAIQRVGKANGYQFIFDSSKGTMLFMEDSDDVTALVKKELGI